MDQFIHLPEFRVIICKKCQFAVLPSEIDAHFTREPVHGLNKESRRFIKERVLRIDGLIQNKQTLSQVRFKYPPPNTMAIPGLEKPRTDGLGCTLEISGERCQFVSRFEQPMREHYRDVHHWVNPRKRGRPKRDLEKEVPWEKRVHCQRFFTHGLHSNLFRVEEKGVPASNPEGAEVKMEKEIQRRIDKVEKEAKKKIEVSDKAQEPDPWLRRVKWDEHLQGLDRDRLRALIEPVNPEEEEDLVIIHKSFDRVMNECQKHVVEEVVGEAALFRVNATEYGKKGENPFYMDLKDKTHLDYRAYWKQILSFVVRAEMEWKKEERPQYRFTRGQRIKFAKLIQKAVEFEGVQVTEEMGRDEREQMADLDRVCLQFCIELLDHKLVGNPYQSPIISGLSILGIGPGQTWVKAIKYTTIYSAIIKIARALVVEQGYQAWCRQIAACKLNGIEEEEAIETTESPYQIIRGMVDRFMGLEGGTRDPSPMDWIISKRTYGMKTRANTTADGEISWIGDKIFGYGLEFDMGQLQTTIQGVVSDARMILMRDLMMIPLDAFGDINEGQVPHIEWASLRDNMAESKVGWSFLDDIRNQSKIDGPWWLWRRIMQKPDFKRQFVQSMEPIRWRQRKVADFERNLVRFQELLLFCCHFGGGQPSRAPEILSVRHRNTSNGGIRNIGVEHGLIFYAPRTHKNYMQTNNMKVVHHWLPREVGELMLYYLWLVLPFWEKVQISVDPDFRGSPFVWGRPALEVKREKEDLKGAKQPVRRGEVERGLEKAKQPVRRREMEEDLEEAEQPVRRGEMEEGLEDAEQPIQLEGLETIDNEVYKSASVWKREWTSARMRGIIQRECKKGMNVKMNINAWRNMVEAISQKFLRHPFEFDSDEEWKDEGDEIWEEQFGHTAPMGEAMYGRLMTEAPGERGSRRVKFRVISQEWHQFVKFPSTGSSSKVSKVRPAQSFYDEAMQQMQIRRRHFMQQVNVQRELEAYMGEGSQFRGEQKKAITAIFQGRGPMLVVMGTGSGKSLLFMLPSFCIQGGTTIVVVPLQSLQTDMKDRCDRCGITSVIWQSGKTIEPASIVFVTPESVLRKGFRDFIRLLRETHRLDRIFIDECHTVLASSATFRPTMRHLGKLVRMGTQVVFLTATLRPRHEDKFCQSMNIIGPGVFKVREATTRPNIQYQVRTYKRTGGGEADDSVIRAVVELVEQLKAKYPAPAKIIVYSQEIKAAEKLSEALGTMLYHAKVDDRSGKDKRLSEWKSGSEESRVAVASNALGLGVDTGDTRAVVHAGMPRDLANYVQESGRAGRDGLGSEAIVLLPEESAKRRYGINSRELRVAQPVVYRHKKETGDWEEEEMAREVEEYIRGRCRRVAIDRVMDNNFGRRGCVEGEEWCDLCQGSKARELIEDEPSKDSPEGSPGFISPEEMEFNRQDRERNWIDFHVQQRERQEVYEVEELERELERFSKRCVYCYIQGYASTDHSIEQCTRPRVEEVREGVEEFIMSIRKKRSMERFSCCLRCYIPQAICERWKHKEDKEERGRWEEDDSQECQYPNVIVPAFWSMMMIKGQAGLEWLYEWAERDGYDIRDDAESERQWLGLKVELGGIEGNNLIRAFKELASQHSDEGLD